MKFTPTILFGVITVVVAIIAVVVVSLKNKEGFGQNYNERICKDFPGPTKEPCYVAFKNMGCGKNETDSHMPLGHGKTCRDLRVPYW